MAMEMRKITTDPGTGHYSVQRIRTDICYLEARLGEMGYEGDCAYERAMSRLYEKLVAECRASLDGLSGTSAP
jgi:hypothetical protein